MTNTRAPFCKSSLAVEHAAILLRRVILLASSVLALYIPMQAQVGPFGSPVYTLASANTQTVALPAGQVFVSAPLVVDPALQAAI